MRWLFFCLLACGLVYCKSARKAEMAMAPRTAMESDDVMATPGSESAKETIVRKVIYTATVNFQAREKDLSQTREKVLNLAKQTGGFMLSSHGKTLVVRVPSEKLDNFLENLKGMSDNFSSSLSARDVTEQYYDTEIRLKNARKVRDRMIELLKKTKNVSETVAIEKELARISETIELYEGQLKRMKGQVAMAKVTITMYKKYEPPKKTEYKPGVLGYPFYYLWQGTKYAASGISWLFVREKEKESE